MAKSALKLFYLFSLFFCVAAQALTGALHQVGSTLTIKSASNGQEFQLGHDSYVQTVYEPDELGHWAMKIRLVDEDGALISDDTFLTSKKYFNQAVAVEFNGSLDVLDENNETKKVPGGVKLVRLADVGEGGWNHYRMVMVNDAGEMIDWTGKVVKNPPILKTSMSNFNQLNLSTHIRNLLGELVNEKEEVEQTGPLISSIRPKCRPQSNAAEPTQEVTSLAPTSSPRPKPRVVRSSNTKLWNGAITPHKILMDERESLKGKKNCQSKLRALESSLLDKTPWGDLTLTELANKIHDVSGEVLTTVKSVSRETASRKHYTSSVNPNYFSNIITKDLAACIAFQETSGHLNPFSQNYTYCNDSKGMISTAHGLGQMTRGTFRKMKNHPAADQLPYITEYAKILEGLDDRSAHALLSTDPHLQIEVILRLLNFEVKYAKWKNPKSSADELMKMAVTQYDHDNKSKYVKNVVDLCVPCMKKKSAGECYASIWK